VSYRDALEAARRHIAALEAELSTVRPYERAPGQPIEAEIGHLRRVLEETRLVLDHERHRRAIAEQAIEQLPFLQRRVADDEQLIAKLRAQVDRFARDAKIVEPRLHELDALHHRARDLEERAERAEREIFRLRMRLALERVSGVVPAERGAELAAGLDAMRARFGPQIWETLEQGDVTHRLKELAIVACHVVWPAKAGASPDADAIIATLEEIGHPLPAIDPWSFGPERPEAPGLRLRIRSIELRAAMKLRSGPLHIVTLEADSGLTAVVR
jgi:hypothetical protein